MEGARIIIIEIGGGERGVGGYIVAELTRNADATEVKQILSKTINNKNLEASKVGTK